MSLIPPRDPEVVWIGVLNLLNVDEDSEQIQFRAVWDGELTVERNVGVDRMGHSNWITVTDMETSAYVFRQMLFDAFQQRDIAALSVEDFTP